MAYPFHVMNARLACFARLATVSLLALAVGCADPLQANTRLSEENVQSTSQAYSGWWGWGWFQIGDQGADLDMGPDSDRTCFLSGVAGYFDIESYGSHAPAAVEIYRANGHWYLSTHGGGILSGSTRVGGTAVCLPTVANRVAAVSWSTGEPAKLLAPLSPKRHCFLTAVRSSIQASRNGINYGNAFDAMDDYVRVWSDSQGWYIGGVGNAEGSAACVDVSGDAGSWDMSDNDEANYHEEDIAYNDTGVQCMLTGVGGIFRFGADFFEQVPWTGVFVSYEPGIRQWTMTVHRFKRGWASCIR